jgi:hypothetical protein
MRRNDQASLTDKNLDQLAEFLSHELEHPALGTQIPDGAHIFHGSYSDATLTQANLQLASKTLLGMTLGYIEDAPLVMVFEYQPGRRAVVDLSSKAQRGSARAFVERFQERNRREMIGRINELVSA